MKFGRFDISIFNFGNFRLDGGAMFGSVPKNLWSKKIPADEENCIALATNSLIIRDGSRVFLVDAGMGDKWNDKQRQIYAIQNNPLPAGFDPGSVTDVILTHLHFDHAGGISRFDGTNKPVPVYPSARIHLQYDNFENAKNPSLKERASYLKDNWGILEFHEVNFAYGSTEIYPDISVHQVNGHTKGQQIVEIKNGGKSIFFVTDLIPTAHHLPVAYQMGYDICAETVIREKEEFLDKAVKNESILVFQHDTDTCAATVARDEKGQFTVKDKVSFD